MGKIYSDKNDLVNGPFDLNQGNEISRYYKQDELKSLIVENNIKASKKLIAFVEDTEGKKKKKKICKVHNLNIKVFESRWKIECNKKATLCITRSP